MWRLLRDRRLAGFRFRRQHPIPPYIADYYCAVARLVVELDGESHVGNEEADRVRGAFFASQGLPLIRFWNTVVFEDRDAVLETVYRACIAGAQDNPKVRHKIDGWGQFRSGHEDPSPPAPLPSGGRGERGPP
jgi:very-short-patch-repair endonuclease